MNPIHVPLRNPSKSSIKDLVAYITDTQGKDHRIAGIRITNCSDDYDVQTALWHMQDAQYMNTSRGTKCAKGELNYHLIVSFRNPEHPPLEVLHAIEDRLCEALGYEEHQRISAVHTDTDHVHMHIAINKIHPKTFNIHDPLRDYLTLGKTCAQLEQEYGLIVDNHTPKKTVEQGRITNIEAKTGLKSLKTYVEEHCLEQLKQAQNWNDVHQALSKYGLWMKKRGNGLIIIAVDDHGKPIKGAHLKNSQVGREFSKAKLEAKFGEFDPAKGDIKAIKHYQPEPLTKLDDPASQKLWDDYRKNQDLTKEQRDAVIASATQQKRININEVLKSKLPAISADYKDEFAQVARAIDLWRQRLDHKWETQSQGYYDNLAQKLAKREYKRQSWLDYLKHKALEGNAQALETLRRRKAKSVLAVNNGFSAKNDDKVKKDEPYKKEITEEIKVLSQREGFYRRAGLPNSANFIRNQVIQLQQDIIIRENERFRQLDHNIYAYPVDSITKNGTIIYKAHGGAIRDDGVHIVPSSFSTKAIAGVLRFITRKKGAYIDIKGDEAFKRKTIWSVIKHCLGGFVFSDQSIEEQRKKLSNDVVTGKITANYLAKWGGENIKAVKERIQYITINLDEYQRNIQNQLDHLNRITNATKHRDNNIINADTETIDQATQGTKEGTVSTRDNNTRQRARYVKVAISKPNTRIIGRIKAAITKYGVPNLSEFRMDDRRYRSEMFLHSDESVYLPEQRSSGNNVMRWPLESTLKEQQRAVNASIANIMNKKPERNFRYQLFLETYNKLEAARVERVRKARAEAQAQAEQSPPPRKRRGR